MSATTHTANAPSMAPASTHRLREAVRSHPFAAYVALAWAASWAYWGAMLARGDIVVPGGSVSHFPGLFGPMLAAFVVTVVVAGRAGVTDLLRRMLMWRVGLRWYALAALPFGLFLLGVAVLAVTGGTPPSVDDLASYSGLPLVGLPLVVCAAFLGNGFGEEVGWRGFAQPTLERRMSFLRASVTVAIVWAIWHVPSFPVIETYRAMGLAIVPIFVFGLGSGAIVLGWLYDRSGGSILIAALFHLGLNMGSATLAGRGLPSALATTGVMIWAAAIVIVELRRGRGSGSARAVSRSRLASVRDVAVRGLLASPLRAMTGPGMLLLTYRGRRTGRTYTTPVEYVRDGDRLLILVGAAEHKQWWRNVQAAPEVTVRLGGRVRRATADVVTGAAARAGADAYVARRPRAAASIASAGSGLVMVRLEVA